MALQNIKKRLNQLQTYIGQPDPMSEPLTPPIYDTFYERLYQLSVTMARTSSEIPQSARH